MIKLRQQIETFFRYRNLLSKLVKRDIIVRYRKSFLGMLWTVLNPLLMMCVMTLVFSNLFKTQVENYPVYVLIGMMVFNFHSESSNQAMLSIVDNAALIKKVYIPKYLFPISKSLSSLVNLLFAFVALVIVMIVTGASFHWTILLVIIPLIGLLIFNIGLALFLSAIDVFFRDMTHLYSSAILTAWNYLTPIFYTADIIPNNLKGVIYANPMYYFVTCFRSLIMEGIVPETIIFIKCFGYAIIMLIIGVLMFKRTQDKFILHL